MSDKKALKTKTKKPAAALKGMPPALVLGELPQDAKKASEETKEAPPTTATTPMVIRMPAQEAKVRKLSALDAAAKVLAEAGVPMNCTQMIDAMTTNSYWTSPNGLTPQATLYAAIAREVKTKGSTSRFQKAERGHFTLNH